MVRLLRNRINSMKILRPDSVQLPRFQFLPSWEYSTHSRLQLDDSRGSRACGCNFEASLFWSRSDMELEGWGACLLVECTSDPWLERLGSHGRPNVAWFVLVPRFDSHNGDGQSDCRFSWSCLLLWLFYDFPDAPKLIWNQNIKEKIAILLIVTLNFESATQ